MNIRLSTPVLTTVLWLTTLPLSAQSLFHRLDSLLAEKYRKAKYDTTYITRPQAKWTVMARLNMSGTTIETEGVDAGQPFRSEMEANSKATLSLGASYRGISLSLALNPAKMMGKYNDYEFNFNIYRHDFGLDFTYQDAKNFSGWYHQEGLERVELPDGMLRMKMVNVNAYYAFNKRRFSYPAAFSQSYIQRRSAGSFLLAASGMWQQATFDWEQVLKLRMTNIGIGAGYGYNFVPGRGWLLHLSLLPTFVAYSSTSMTFDDSRVNLHYKFPEFIITGRGAVVRQWDSLFLGMSMVYNTTSIGDKADLTIYNTKWRVQAFLGLRI